MKFFAAVFVAVATIALAPMDAFAQAEVTICTGGKKGVYYAKGKQMERASGANLTFKALSTAGSWFNIREVAKDAGQCQAAIVQADAYALLKKKDAAAVANIDRVGALHDEYVHLVCNGDLDGSDETILESGDDGSRKIAVGKQGSGAWVTWMNISAEDDDYARVTKPVFIGGTLAASKVADGSDADCLLYVAGLGSSYMNNINARYGKKLRLRDFDDSDFNDAVDPKGNRLYEFANIDDDLYEDGLQSGNLYDTDTIKMKAIMVVNSRWASENEDAFELFIEAMSTIQ